MSNSWQLTGKIKPYDLTPSRLQLHYAIQFVAAADAALAEPLPDFSHVSLEWNLDLETFAGVPIRATTPFRVALDPISLTSILLNRQGDTIATLPLHQQTLEVGMNWLRSEIAKLGADVTQIALLSYPPDDFPDHAIAHGAAFDASQGSAERQELAHFYANTHQLLQEIVANTEDASPIHIWPHHFDMATLISLPSRKNGEMMTIGMGLSPGDASYNEPYWYVSPYPYFSTDNLPPLDGNGVWHTQHWLGAVLTASQLVVDSAQAQRSQVRSFLLSAWKASTVLLQSGG
jgi:hypothetical protein